MKKWAIVMLHAGYWMMYTFFVIAILEGMARVQPLPAKHLFRALFCSPFSAGAYWPGIMCFYIFYFALFDRYLKKRRIGAFLLAALGTAIAAGLLTMLFMRPFFPQVAPFNGKTAEFIPIALFLAFVGTVHGTVGLVIRGFVAWYGDIKIKLELNKKNYEMELELIRAQINPHFLFNTINNIDVLIQKDAAKASEYLNKLSDMMRFMLYETKTEKIPVAKELDYVEKYIELQRIRTSNPNYIQYQTRGESAGLLIEPMLFIPFIENAFKHAGNKKQENAVNVMFTFEKTQMRFECENACAEDTGKQPPQGGLGNELIRRRLALLYPGKHILEISEANGMYKVNLLVQFN